MKLQQKSRFQLSILWMFSMLLFPVLLVQGYLVKRSALRLPDGAPPDRGVVGAGDPLVQITGVGDSVIAGVGLSSLSQTVPAQLATILSEKTGQAIGWQSSGVNGERLAELITRLKHSSVARADILVVSVGVNDVTGLTGLLKWQLQLTELVPLLKARCSGMIVLLSVPPMEAFTALPQPLRWVLGVRAAMLDKSLVQIASLVEQIQWVNVQLKFDAEHLAEDGYHPNGQACAEIAGHIATSLKIEALLQSEKKPRISAGG